jgi:two-component system, NarL family, response regulator DegU
MPHSPLPFNNVWIVDDNEYYCQQVIEILKESRVVKEVTAHYRVESAIKSISCISKFPEVILLDVYFSGSNMTGLDALPLIKKLAPKTKIIILTAFEEEINAQFALKLGASGFLVKLAQGNDILKAIKVAMLNGIFVDSRMIARLMSNKNLDKKKAFENILTLRENEITDLLRFGYKRPQIADKLSISLATVNTHLRNIHSKLDVTSDLTVIAKLNQ